MDDKEKNQKTIVAIIAGLLIGGLLVWIFSSMPKDTAPEEDADTETTEEQPTNEDDNDADENGTTSPRAEEVRSDASITVDDQPAGAVVMLSGVTYPGGAGWIVVREEVAGNLGNILGASRYNEAEGLNPTQVELLRNTEAGKTYHVIAYSENGDKIFDLNEDAPVMMGGAMVEGTFTAQ